TGGTITDNGTIDVTGASKIDGNATLNSGAVTVEAKRSEERRVGNESSTTDKAGIELDNTVILKGGATIQGGPITNLGTLEVAGAATLLNDGIINRGPTVEVAS